MRQAGYAVFVKGTAGGQLDATHAEILLAHAIDGAVHSDIAVAQRGRAADAGRDAVHIALFGQRSGIAGHQGSHTGGALVTKAAARKNFDGVGADGADVLQNLQPRALAERHHRNHRSNADDDAQHGQKGAQAVRVHGQQSHAKRLAKAVTRGLPAAAGSRHRFEHSACRCGIGPGQPVGHHAPVAQLNDAVGVRGHLHVVRHHDDGMALCMQLQQNLDHLGAALRVQRAGRLVGQQHVAAVHEGARNAHALLLPAGQLARLVLQAVGHAQAREQRIGAFAAQSPWAPRIDGGYLHVADGAQVTQQVVALKNKTEMLAPQLSQLVGTQLAGRPAGHAVAAGAGFVQATQNIHQRGLARARSADDGHHLAGAYVEVDVGQHGDRAFTRRKVALQPAQF